MNGPKSAARAPRRVRLRIIKLSCGSGTPICRTPFSAPAVRLRSVPARRHTQGWRHALPNPRNPLRQDSLSISLHRREGGVPLHILEAGPPRHIHNHITHVSVMTSVRSVRASVGIGEGAMSVHHCYSAVRRRIWSHRTHQEHPSNCPSVRLGPQDIGASFTPLPH